MFSSITDNNISISKYNLNKIMYTNYGAFDRLDEKLMTISKFLYSSDSIKWTFSA